MVDFVRKLRVDQREQLEGSRKFPLAAHSGGVTLKNKYADCSPDSCSTPTHYDD